MPAPSPSSALPPTFSRHQSYSNRSRKRVSTVFSPRSTEAADVFDNEPSPHASCSTGPAPAPKASFPSSAASFRSAPPAPSSSARAGGVAKRFSPRPANGALLQKPIQLDAARPAVQSAALGSAGTLANSHYRLLFEDEYQDEVIEHMHLMEVSRALRPPGCCPDGR